MKNIYTYINSISINNILIDQKNYNCFKVLIEHRNRTNNQLSTVMLKLTKEELINLRDGLNNYIDNVDISRREAMKEEVKEKRKIFNKYSVKKVKTHE